MTEQEQIEDIAKYVCNVCDFKCDWFQSGMKEDSICTTAQETAEALYNAGYRKIDEFEAENKQLKTECALLDDELRIARQETIDVLNELWEKVKDEGVDYKIGMRALSEEIDELIKEQLKK